MENSELRVIALDRAIMILQSGLASGSAMELAESIFQWLKGGDE